MSLCEIDGRSRLAHKYHPWPDRSSPSNVHQQVSGYRISYSLAELCICPLGRDFHHRTPERGSFARKFSICCFPRKTNTKRTKRGHRWAKCIIQLVQHPLCQCSLLLLLCPLMCFRDVVTRISYQLLNLINYSSFSLLLSPFNAK
jgi:hypothetical protein